MTPFFKLISLIFHPVFIPSLACYCMFHFNDDIAMLTPENNFKMLNVLNLFVAACLICLALVLQAGSGHMRFEEMNKNHRILLALGAVVIYFVVLKYKLLEFQNISQYMHPSFIFAIMGIITALTLASMISYFWKISFHTLAIGGFTGMFAALGSITLTQSSWVVVAALIASGLVASARVWLKSHDYWQVAAGWLLGFLVQFYWIKFPLLEV
jgi:membrane-associated HD superfamily phosphohydrolase